MGEEAVIKLYKETKQKSHSFTRFVLIILAISGIVVFIFTRMYGLARVSGDSMNPTLKNGQLVMYSKNVENIKTGDIVILKNDKQTNGELYIKRVLAPENSQIVFPGEFSASRPFYWLTYKENTDGDTTAVPIYEEYTINYTQICEQKIDVKSGYIYVCGDNRDNSVDSRKFGPVAITDVIGVVK